MQSSLPSQPPAATSSTRRKRDPLAPEAVEALARTSVISDFNRASDYRRLARAYNLMNRTAVDADQETNLASAFVNYFQQVANSCAKISADIAQGDLQYRSPLSLTDVVAKWRTSSNLQFSTPNPTEVQHGKKNPFTVATERLPLDILHQGSENTGVTEPLVKHLPARIRIEYHQAARTADWQQTSAFVTAGAGSFATFLSAYAGYYYARAAFAATPVFAMVAYRGFVMFETSQEQFRFKSHAKELRV